MNCWVIIKITIGFQESDEQIVEIIQLSVIPLKEESYYDIYNQYTDYNYIINCLMSLCFAN